MEISSFIIPMVRLCHSYIGSANTLPDRQKNICCGSLYTIVMRVFHQVYSLCRDLMYVYKSVFFYLTGFAVGEQFCNQESLYITNQSFWTFEIRKFTFMVFIYPQQA